MADAVLASIEGEVASRRIYDLVEERSHSLQELVLSFRSWLGYGQARVIRVPNWIGSVIFILGDAISSLGWRPPLRTTALRQIEVGVTGDPSAWIKERGRVSPGLHDTLRRYPSSVQERWFGRLWLMKPLIIAVLRSQC